MYSHGNKYLLFFIFFSLLISFDVAAQKFLALEKSGKIKRLRFYVNETINVRLNNEKKFRSGYVDEFTDTSFFLNGENIPLSKVNAIRVDKTGGGHAFLRTLSVMLPVGGVLILGVAATNSVINNDYPLIPESTCYVAGGMIVGGALLYPLTYRVYKTKHHPLKIIDVTIVPK